LTKTPARHQLLIWFGTVSKRINKSPRRSLLNTPGY
jgi:hypothetical protein